ncbi:glutamate racemase [Aquifex sp.]
MKIGIFDSGVGGLTVLKAVRKHYPKVDIVYLGDTARVPYGTKSRETVIRYSLECAEFLREKGVELLVVACNTASSCALDILREKFDFPVFGVIEPGVREAVKRTKNRKVGVIGTTATIKSGAYQEFLKLLGNEVVAKACPLFVPLVEEGILDGEIARKIVEYYLSELKSSGIDTLILGCTHYPLLKPVIKEFLGEVEVIDSSEAVSQSLKEFIKNEGEGRTELFFTDLYQNLDFLIELILGEKITPKLAEVEIY